MVSGISRGFAFLEFHTAEDAARWMTENRVRLLTARSITDLFGGNFYNAIVIIDRTCSLYMDTELTWSSANARVRDAQMMTFIAAENLVIVIVADIVKQMRVMTLMLLLTVSTSPLPLKPSFMCH